MEIGDPFALPGIGGQVVEFMGVGSKIIEVPGALLAKGWFGDDMVKFPGKTGDFSFHGAGIEDILPIGTAEIEGVDVLFGGAAALWSACGIDGACYLFTVKRRFVFEMGQVDALAAMILSSDRRLSGSRCRPDFKICWR